MVLEYDKTTEMVMRLGTALIKAVDEHGAPNSFAFSELVGKDAMLAGKAVRKMWGPFCANLDARRPGMRVNFSGGRLHVTHEGKS